jgi:hypothetical protein
MRAMKTLTSPTLLAGAAAVVLSLSAGPALADELVFAVDEVEEPADDGAVDEEAEAEIVEEEAEAPASDDHRIAIAETPRDRVGLLVLGSLAAAGLFGLMNARRQLKGERPQASGEFRWR